MNAEVRAAATSRLTMVRRRGVERRCTSCTNSRGLRRPGVTLIDISLRLRRADAREGRIAGRAAAPLLVLLFINAEQAAPVALNRAPHPQDGAPRIFQPP